ncbi:MAG: hypothetical protein HYV68_00965 [Candidatus Taylorbacteria bacterium]|nr:hypothetical protein [Candidatus Taylorbacteria bacterium]
MSLPHKKNFLRDVLPKSAIEKPVRRRPVDDEQEVKYHKIVEPADLYVEEKAVHKGGGKWQIWTIASLAVLGLTAAIFYVFSSAEVVITPRIDEARFNNDFRARKDVVMENWNEGLSFSVNKIENLGSKSVAADGERMQQKKASGKITIYNDYSTKPQRLIKNTRFETADGLVYRIDQSIVVPGSKVENGKTVPGSVVATVYADEPGTKYNIGSTTFKIPGFKGDPKYAGFYGKSDAPMTGGFSGVAKYVSDARQQTVRAEIRSELEKQILSEAPKSLKPGSFIPKGAYTVEFESQPAQPAEGGAVTISEKATVTIYTFRNENWDSYLAQATPFASAIGSSTVMIQNRDELSLAWKSRPTVDSPEISFTVKGNARFVWVPDGAKLASSLAGSKKSELQKILGDYSEVLSASAALSPFWSTHFPKDPVKITITTKIPEFSPKR